jgi:hypothetical protein
MPDMVGVAAREGDIALINLICKKSRHSTASRIIRDFKPSAYCRGEFRSPDDTVFIYGRTDKQHTKSLIWIVMLYAALL